MSFSLREGTSIFFFSWQRDLVARALSERVRVVEQERETVHCVCLSLTEGSTDELVPIAEELQGNLIEKLDQRKSAEAISSLDIRQLPCEVISCFGAVQQSGPLALPAPGSCSDQRSEAESALISSALDAFNSFDCETAIDL